MRRFSRCRRSALCLALAAAFAPTLARAQKDAERGVVSQSGPQLTRAPELVTFVEAEYPEAERAAGKSAAVVLQITISAAGLVDDAAVQESAGAAFDSAAIAAAKQFVFRPAEIDGHPAPIRILYRYEFVLHVETPTSARFVGHVRTRNANAPIPGVRLELDSGQSALTDAAGYFELDGVPPGKHTVTLSGERLTALRTEETFEAGQQLEATYDVQLNAPEEQAADSDDLELVVVAPPLRRQVVSTQVSAEQARKVPGTQGDVLRVVENLPGVARSAVGSGQLVVWGAAPEDTRVYVDGVRVPRLYHNGGLRSVISSDFVDTVDLVPGGYGAAFGRGLGGLVTVSTRALDPDRAHGALAVDLLDASGSLRAPIADKLSFSLAARRSHLDQLLSGVIDNKVEDYFPIPRYYDGQARLRYQLSKTDSVELTGLLSGDHIQRTVVNADPARTAREARDVGFQRFYVGYRSQLADGSTLSLTPYFGFDHTRLADRFGTTPTDLSNDTSLGGLRASWRKKSLAWLTLELGLDAELSRSALRRSGSVGAPPREGDIRVFGQPPPDQINVDDWRVTQVGIAPYIEGDVALFDDALHVFPGLRADPNAISVSRRLPPLGDAPAVGFAQQDFALEPRVAVRYAISKRVAVKAAYGAYHQPPQPEDLSATFGNPKLSPARADHALLGGSWSITDTLSVELTGFYAVSSGLAVRSPLASPTIAEALVAEGEGRAYGAQVLLRQELSKRFFGWLSYSLVRSERRANAGAGWRLFDYDQTHILTALFSYDLGAGFELGSRVRYATGFPRTEVIDAFYDVRRDIFQPVFGPHNGLRIPVFFQLDLRASKRFEIGSTELDVYLELQNVTDRENPEELVYNNDYTQRKYITGLPILPVAGVRWTF